MPNRIPHISSHAVARMAVALAVVLLAAFMGQQLSEPDALTSGASETAQYGYVVYSGGDIWHALPGGR